MFKSRVFFFLLVAGMFLQNVNAEDTGSALEETLNCLRNQNCEPAQTGAGKAADQKALEAAGGNAAGKQALYNISADIMPILVSQSGGDPDKMLAIMQKAQTDPEGFFNSLPLEIQNKIKSAADSMEKNQ
jgi:hypothetical protein